MEREEALAVARTLTFTQFSRFDFDAWAGVKSALPMIAENETHTFIIDGYTLVVVPYGEGDEEHFDLREYD